MPRLPRLSSFAHLNIAQFLGAFNDNFYKGLTIYLLLDLSSPDQRSAIFSLVGAFFVLPFLVLSSTAGKLADRFSKSRIIALAKIAEIFVMALGFTALYTRSFSGAIAVLCAMAAQSALFGPSKYGIIPELVRPEKLAQTNAWLAMFTNLAIVLGTGFAGWIGAYADRDLVLGGAICIFIALIGALATIGIESTPARAGKKELSPWFWQDIGRNFQKAARFGHLQTFLLAYFIGYHIAGFLQLNIIPYCIEELGKSDAFGNGLFAFTAVGIGIGAVLAGYSNRSRLKLHHVPHAIIGAAFSLAGLALFPHSQMIVLLSLLMTGICMGFFIVPTESYLQLHAPEADRGEIMATANFLTFAGSLAAAASLFLLGFAGGLSPSARFGLYSAFAFLAGLAFRQKIMRRFDE